MASKYDCIPNQAYLTLHQTKERILIENLRKAGFEFSGNAMSWVKSIALKYCKGYGIDVGAGVWPLPGAVSVDKDIHTKPDVLSSIEDLEIPLESLDYVFTSHCIESCSDLRGVIERIFSFIKPGGVFFAYLPHEDAVFWSPRSQKDHRYELNDEIMDYVCYGLFKKKLISLKKPDKFFSFYVCYQK